MEIDCILLGCNGMLIFLELIFNMKIKKAMEVDMRKQAYLIIAHKDDFVFRSLIKLLDYPKNDIFVHMDAKNRQYDPDDICHLTLYSRIYHTDRVVVTWGGYSQIVAEILLLKKATSMGEYQHYHLLSGADLPIKTQREIVDFFEKNEGKEFVRFEKYIFSFSDRIRYYYPFQELLGRRTDGISKLINKLSLEVQRFVGVHRNRDIAFQKGTNWFSIKDSLARYIIRKESWIKQIFGSTYCCDEIFLQTLIVNSDFRRNLYHEEFDNDIHAIMRLIDWGRGNPYVFRKKDFNELMASDMMFARKFDEKIDVDIVRAIVDAFRL